MMTNGEPNICLLQTDRLKVKLALPNKDDVDIIYRLWTSPDVMTFVGFPKGLNTSHVQIKEQICSQSESEFDSILIVILKATNERIGNCKLGSVDNDNIADTDIKLLPEFWGNGYGVELKRALVGYLFEKTECLGVKGTPNKLNLASIKMQESVGGRKVSEGSHKFPKGMKIETVDVHYVEYIVYREEWLNK